MIFELSFAVFLLVGKNKPCTIILARTIDQTEQDQTEQSARTDPVITGLRIEILEQGNRVNSLHDDLIDAENQNIPGEKLEKIRSRYFQAVDELSQLQARERDLIKAIKQRIGEQIPQDR